MKKLWHALCRDHRVLAGWLVWLANWALVPFALLTWRSGVMIWGMYLLIQVGVTCMDFRFVRSPWTMGLLGLNHIAATAVAHKIAGELYYSRVSSDYMTPMISSLGLKAGVMIVAALTLGAMVLKWKEKKHA